MFKIIIAPVVSQGDGQVRFLVNSRTEKLLNDHSKKADIKTLLYEKEGESTASEGLCSGTTRKEMLNADISRVMRKYEIERQNSTNSLLVLLVPNKEDIQEVACMLNRQEKRESIEVIPMPENAVICMRITFFVSPHTVPLDTLFQQSAVVQV